LWSWCLPHLKKHHLVRQETWFSILTLIRDWRMWVSLGIRWNEERIRANLFSRWWNHRTSQSAFSQCHCPDSARLHTDWNVSDLCNTQWRKNDPNDIYREGDSLFDLSTRWERRMEWEYRPIYLAWRMGLRFIPRLEPVWTVVNYSLL
jgi:hypothetical protein